MKPPLVAAFLVVLCLAHGAVAQAQQSYTTLIPVGWAETELSMRSMRMTFGDSRSFASLV